jgi:hypothetical protein
MSEDQIKVEPFLRDAVDHVRDKGEPWRIGWRESRLKPKDGKKPERIPVNLWIRRVPKEVNNDIGKAYRSERILKDNFGNEKPEYYFEPERLDAMIEHKAMWMWVDVENFVVEILDEDAARLYEKAMGNGKPLKVGDMVQLDGHLTDEVKDHLMQRFPFIRTEIMACNRQYESSDAHREEYLRKN